MRRMETVPEQASYARGWTAVQERFVEIGGPVDDLRAAAQLIQAEPAGGVVLAEDGRQPVSLGIS